jgi:hypothetical protein
MQQHWKREVGRLLLLLGTAEGVRPVPSLLYAMASRQALERGHGRGIGPVGRSARAYHGSAQERIGYGERIPWDAYKAGGA